MCPAEPAGLTRAAEDVGPYGRFPGASPFL